jgi:pimeloyl-ACP methyl ester carboxylesterase
MADTTVMELQDGRELAWLELGNPMGPPVLAFHGTPGSRLQLSFLPDRVKAAGVRFIALDRPGYGHSTFQPNRRLIDWPLDVAALADHLGLERFSVVGISGGGPHAAVCARFMGERVVATGIVSGVGQMSDAAAAEGMMPLNRALSSLARRSTYLVYPLFAAQTVLTRRWPDGVLRSAPKHLPSADAAIMTRPEVMAAVKEDFRLASSTTAMAAAQDFALFARGWGFRLEDIIGTVHVWHGDADRNVPYAHGRHHAEAIPGARFHDCPGEGHMLVIDHLEEILRTVTSR